MPVWHNPHGGSANEGWYYTFDDEDAGVGPFSSRSAARAALREDRSQPRSCEACGAVFTPIRADQRFCGGNCRVAAWRSKDEATNG